MVEFITDIPATSRNERDGFRSDIQPGWVWCVFTFASAVCWREYANLGFGTFAACTGRHATATAAAAAAAAAAGE